MKLLCLALCLCSVSALSNARPDPTPSPVVIAFIEAGPRISDWRELRKLTDPTPTPTPQQPRRDLTPGLRTVPRNMTIPAGTLVDVRLTSTVRTDTYKEGDVIGFEVVQPVVVNGIVVIDQGAAAKGRVIRLKRARTFGRGGDLYFSVYEVTAVNGKRLLTDFTYRFKGVNEHLRTAFDVASAATLAGIYGAAASFYYYDNAYGAFFAPVGLLFGTRKGHEAEQPVGKQFEVAVRNNVPLEGDEISDSPRAAMWNGTKFGPGLPAMFDRNRVSMNDILNARSLRELPH